MTSHRHMNKETVNRDHGETPQTPRWNFVAMGQVGLPGWHHSPLRPDVNSAGLRKGGVTEQLLKDRTMKTTILMSGARA